LLAPGSHELEVTAGRALPAWASWSLEGAEPVSAGERVVPSWDATYVAPDAEPGEPARSREAAGVPPVLAERAPMAPLTTLRTALLSWDGGAGDPRVDTSRSIAPTPAPSAARAMIDAMRLPMLGDTTPDEGVGSRRRPA
jgi:hypothetical protein